MVKLFCICLSLKVRKGEEHEKKTARNYLCDCAFNSHLSLPCISSKLELGLTFEEEEEIDIQAVMAEIKELEAKRTELDAQIEVYLKDLGIVE